MKRIVRDILELIIFVTSLVAILALFVFAFIGHWWAWVLLISLIIYLWIKDLNKNTNQWRNFRG